MVHGQQQHMFPLFQLQQPHPPQRPLPQIEAPRGFLPRLPPHLGFTFRSSQAA
jgi:hypothetical protein